VWEGLGRIGVVDYLGVEGSMGDYRLEFLMTNLSDLLISSIILIDATIIIHTIVNYIVNYTAIVLIYN
jgi:hypothetical protein